jgi:dextranase
MMVERSLGVDSIRILDAYPDRGLYRPGQGVRIVVDLANDSSESVSVQVVATIRFLTHEVGRITREVVASPGSQRVDLLWMPPQEHPRGYGVDLAVVNHRGTVLGTAATAFDVLDHWTQAPRYGFLTNFGPDRRDMSETMEWLVRYHINGLQFYDWMYRHEDLLTSNDPYQDPLGRLLSRRTVDALISAAHQHGLAAMPYTAIYGASLPFYEAHPDWALLTAKGEPFRLGDNFLVYMDPSPDSPWTQHLMAEFAEMLRRTDFDGIHIDQYGDPKSGFNAAGQPVDLAQVFPAFINRAKATATSIRPGASVVFNAVNNWPITTVAPADQDFVYIEVWPPNTLYQDLWRIIVNAQKLSGGKAVVLAAYIEPSRFRNVLLTDAVIFASGAYHIELGEPGGMLSEAYFPNYQKMSGELVSILRRYYDFIVRYANVLALGTQDSTEENSGRLTIEGVNTDAERVYKKVWPITRRGDGFETINLINLLDIANPEWNGLLLADPAPQDNLRVRYHTDRGIKRVWLASPDSASPQPVSLVFSLGQDDHGEYVEFTVPRLEYWDLIVVEFAP